MTMFSFQTALLPDAAGEKTLTGGAEGYVAAMVKLEPPQAAGSSTGVGGAAALW